MRLRPRPVRARSQLFGPLGFSSRPAEINVMKRRLSAAGSGESLLAKCLISNVYASFGNNCMPKYCISIDASSVYKHCFLKPSKTLRT